MEALREKFRPETKTTRGGRKSDEEENGPESEADYFSLKRRRDQSGGDISSRRESSSNSSTPGQHTPAATRTPAARVAALSMEPIRTTKTSSPTSFYTPIPPASSHHHLSSTPKPKPKPKTPLSNGTPSMSDQQFTSQSRSFQPVFRRSSTRRQVQAGDLLSMANEDDSFYRPHIFGPVTPKPIHWGKNDPSGASNSRSRAISTTRRTNGLSTTNIRAGSGSSVMADFNLRDAVMSSLAKSIGLIQPPRPESTTTSMSNSPFPPPSGSVSMTSSPPLSAQRSATFNSSFGPLSMLQRSMGGSRGNDDETSSMATGVSSGWGAANGEGQEELENEVEILFFPKGELIVREGEKNAGLFFVIDGFLEVGLRVRFRHSNLPRVFSCSCFHIRSNCILRD